MSPFYLTKFDGLDEMGYLPQWRFCMSLSPPSPMSLCLRTMIKDALVVVTDLGACQGMSNQHLWCIWPMFSMDLKAWSASYLHRLVFEESTRGCHRIIIRQRELFTSKRRAFYWSRNFKHETCLCHYFDIYPNFNSTSSLNKKSGRLYTRISESMQYYCQTRCLIWVCGAHMMNELWQEVEGG